MSRSFKRKLYPLFVGLFALSLVLSACGGDSSDQVVDPAAPAAETPAAAPSN